MHTLTMTHLRDIVRIERPTIDFRFPTADLVSYTLYNQIICKPNISKPAFFLHCLNSIPRNKFRLSIF